MNYISSPSYKTAPLHLHKQTHIPTSTYTKTTCTHANNKHYTSGVQYMVNEPLITSKNGILLSKNAYRSYDMIIRIRSEGCRKCIWLCNFYKIRSIGDYTDSWGFLPKIIIFDHSGNKNTANKFIKNDFFGAIKWSLALILLILLIFKIN